MLDGRKDGRMDGQTDRGKTVYLPPPSGSGGINIYLLKNIKRIIQMHSLIKLHQNYVVCSIYFSLLLRNLFSIYNACCLVAKILQY